MQCYRMPRVNRTAVLSLLIVSSSVFLLFQLYYYRKYVSKVRHNVTANDDNLFVLNVNIEVTFQLNIKV